MHRYRRAKKSFDELTLDSLMDVLTCSVGVMLFIVIFAVIEAKGTGISLYSPPLLREPPLGAQRVLIICSEGRVRILDAHGAVERLLGSARDLTYDNVPQLVNQANKENVLDDYFRYRLLYRDEQYNQHNRKRVVSLRVEPHPGVQGESRDELKTGNSAFETAISRMDRRDYWFAFGVDKKSLNVFREARDIVIRYGFSTGWDPLEVEFPHEEVVLGGELRKQVEGKPESGLRIVQ